MNQTNLIMSTDRGLLHVAVPETLCCHRQDDVAGLAELDVGTATGRGVGSRFIVWTVVLERDIYLAGGTICLASRRAFQPVENIWRDNFGKVRLRRLTPADQIVDVLGDLGLNR